MIFSFIENLRFTYKRFSLTYASLGPASLAFSYQWGFLLFCLHAQASYHCSCWFEPKISHSILLHVLFSGIWTWDLMVSGHTFGWMLHLITCINSHTYRCSMESFVITGGLMACQSKLILFNAFWYSCREEKVTRIYSISAIDRLKSWKQIQV